jgi:hypothetical protein
MRVMSRRLARAAVAWLRLWLPPRGWPDAVVLMLYWPSAPQCSLAISLMAWRNRLTRAGQRGCPHQCEQASPP